MARPLDTDWLQAGPLLVERLSGIEGIVSAAGARDLVDVQEQAQATPAVYAIYVGDRMGESEGDAQEVWQRWLVVLAVRSVSDMLGGTGLLTEAGLLLPRIRASLIGWKVLRGTKPLRCITSPPVITTEDFAYYPLLFELGTFIDITPQ